LMMIKYLFAHACNALSKDGTIKTRESVWFSALTLLAVGTCCWIWVCIVLFYYYILDTTLKLTGSILPLIATFLVLYFLAVKDEKHKTIIDQYTNESPDKNRTGKLITAIYIFTPIILLMIVAMIINGKF
ncbi:MAG TPA: hypothetical protein VGD31_08120, partial [Sphingobacteriaceae bacterium]